MVILPLEGSVWRKNSRARPRDEYSKQIEVNVCCCAYEGTKRLAQGRVGWRAVSNQSPD